MIHFKINYVQYLFKFKNNKNNNKVSTNRDTKIIFKFLKKSFNIINTVFIYIYIIELLYYTIS